MKKISRHLTVILLTTIFSCRLFSQDSTAEPRYHISVFTPLFLDSAFNEDGSYRLGTTFPKYLYSGIEFYQGLLLAIDTLEKEGLKVDINIHDSKSEKTPLTYVINSDEFQNTDLIIGNVNASEAKTLANIASRKNIPFINATYPNDAGINNNPEFVILNSTLLTHCTAIYKFIQKNHSLAPVILFRKKGAQEDKLTSYFQDIARSASGIPLKIKYVTLDDTIDSTAVIAAIGDVASTTVCIAGSLDLNFGQQLTKVLASQYAEHPSIVFAMPTWWEATNFSGNNFKNIEIVYSTPFYMPATHPIVVAVQNLFKTKYFSRPSDMVYRGYETLYHFAHLLILNGRNLGSGLSDKRFKLINDFDIQPVLDSKNNTLDYFENKKIYFVKKVNGNVTMVY